MAGGLMENMGFMKNILIENGFNKRKVVSSLNNESMVCRFCGSRDVRYSKFLCFGKIQGKVFHYKLICNSCNKQYYIKRAKQIYDIIKFQNWEKSKNFKIYEQKIK